MKYFKYIICMFLFVFIFLPINSYAAEVMELIPVGTNASVSTDLFQYDFVFNTTGVTFTNITNKSNTKVPVSINILMFDENKKNVGYLTYCSDRDINSDYASFKLNSGASTNFYISVVSRYFVDGKTANDVKYIAVQNENKYCEIGGYSKYKELTIEQIKKGGVVSDVNEKVALVTIKSYLKNNLLKIIAIVGFVFFGFLFIFGLFINSLHRKIYNKGSVLAFIPIANMYLCVKLAFGSTFGIIYLIGLVLSLFVSRFIPIFSGIVGLLGGLSFVVVIFKLITKNYFLFIGNQEVNKNGLGVSRPVIRNDNKVQENAAPVVPTVEEVVEENKEEALDLSYNDGKASFNNLSNTTSSAFDDKFNYSGNVDNSTSTTNTNNTFINTNQSDLNTTNNNSNNNKEGESDLSKFFR